MARQPKPVPMCVVRIGYAVELMLPSAAGMKLVELLQQSVEVRRDFVAGSDLYTIRDQPDVEFSTVKPSQVRAPGRNGPALEDRRFE